MRHDRARAWGLLPALVAPIALIGGWTLAAALQPGVFDATMRSISSLAALGMPHRDVMTAALAATGVAHVGTALSLAPAARAGRVVHAVGGLATIAVAALPLPADGGSSTGHAVAAGVSLTALAVWPALAVRGDRLRCPTVLRPAVGITATVLLLAALAWFAVELFGDGSREGLAERVAAGAQAVWPLIVWLGCRRRW